MNEFLEELKKLCEKYDAKITTCSCCGLTVYAKGESIHERDNTQIDKNGLGDGW